MLLSHQEDSLEKSNGGNEYVLVKPAVRFAELNFATFVSLIELGSTNLSHQSLKQNLELSYQFPVQIS